MEPGKSKACFHMSYSQPPNKSVVKNIMDKLTINIATKRMPFAFLVGDHPVYVLITLLKSADSPSSRIETYVGALQKCEQCGPDQGVSQRPGQSKRCQECMQNLVTCMHEFHCLPFDPALPTLRTLQSAMAASGKLFADFNSASAAGEETLTSFLRERVFRIPPSMHPFL